MKSRKRKRDSSKSNEPVPNVNGETDKCEDNENYYGTLVKRNTQRCEFCDMVFNNRYDSLIHTARHIIIPLIKQSVHVCKDCLFCFTSQNDLKIHMKSKHRIATVKLSDMIEEVVKTQVKIKCENLNLNLNMQQDCPSNSEVTVKKSRKVTDTDSNLKVPEINIEKSSPKDLINHKPITNVSQSKLKPEITRNTMEHTKSHSPPIQSLNNKKTETAKPVASETLSSQQFLIQPAYLVPHSNPNMPNQVMYNQVFQIQPLPLMTPEFGLSQMQQPFLSMIPNAVFSPNKPQEEEEEFILPDLEPTIRMVPSVQPAMPVPQPFAITSLQTSTKESRTPPNLTSNLKAAARTYSGRPTIPPKQSDMLKSMEPSNNQIPLLKYTDASTDLINKSPLLIKQLLMKSPEMVSNMKSRLVFEDDDDVICITDLESKDSHTPIHKVTSVPTQTPKVHNVPTQTQKVQNVPMQTQKLHNLPSQTQKKHNVPTQTQKTHNGPTQTLSVNNVPSPNLPSRFLTIENGKIAQELQKLSTEFSHLPIANGSAAGFNKNDEDFNSKSVHYDRLIQPGMYMCKRCPKLFPNRYDQILHEAEVHLSIVTGVKGHHCPGCDYYVNWGRLTHHSKVCNPPSNNKVSICPTCKLKYFDKVRHDRIYHLMYSCRCGAVFKTLQGLQSHDIYASCSVVQSQAGLCEVCEIFITRQAAVKFEFVSEIKKYGKKFECDECGSFVDVIKVFKFTRRKKCKTDVVSRGQDEKTVNFDMRKKKINTNEKRLLNIQKRLKQITHMSKF